MNSDKTKTDILSLSREELTEAVAQLSQPAYRAKQIYDWLHVKCVSGFDEMTNLPKTLLLQLDDNFVIFACTIEKKAVSMYDDTVKYLFRLPDGEFLECVVMSYRYGCTVCVSSQVGCKMGCSFCASGIGGFKRNLAPSELLAQVYAVQRDLSLKVSHIVLMGMGEPLDNYDNVLKFIRLICDEKGQNLGIRKISLSTCGIVPRIYDLAGLGLGLTLSVSLHAPNDDIRCAIMPVNRRWSISELLAACSFYTSRTSRRISFEYTLIDGVNDSAACAKELAALLRGMLCHVNLIPVNEVTEAGNKRSTDKSIQAFYDILTRAGITTTVRRSLGSDINASCGQLRLAAIKEKNHTDGE